MEQGKAPEAGVAGEEGLSDHAKRWARLASRRECSLLENYLNSKYGNPVKGRIIPRNLASWSKHELEKSLKTA